MGAVAASLCVAACGGPEATLPPVEKTSEPASSPTPSTPVTDGGILFTLDDPGIDESSGLARSTAHPGVFYTHNDKGSGPIVFAVDASGTRATLTLEGAEATDWEDVASTPDGRVWIADIGDRDQARDSVSVEVLEEPTPLASGPVASTTYRFRYPDGQHDAEALLVHPSSARVHVVTKDSDDGGIYAAPRRLDEGRTHLLRRVADAPANVTGGDFAPDGGALVLRNYRAAYFYPRLGADRVVQKLPDQEQGESITFDETGEHVLVGTEGSASDVLQVAVPPRPWD